MRMGVFSRAESFFLLNENCALSYRVRTAKQELAETSTKSRMVRIALDKSAEEFRYRWRMAMTALNNTVE
jgi:hypothetical protein